MLKWLIILGPVYIGILILLAFITRKRNKSANDFMMGGYNIGTLLGFMTFSATLFSTFTLMGMPDFFRTHGIGAWIFLAVSDGAMVFLILWFGYHLRIRAKQHDYKGMAGFLSYRYNTKYAGYLYLGGVFLFLIPYVAIQIRGVSMFLDAAFEGLMPLWAWSILIIGIMVFYSETGGLKAIMYSDVLQGLLLLTVVWIIAGKYLSEEGGLYAIFDKVGQKDESLLSVPGPKGLFNRQFLLASFFAITLIPITQPQISTRIMVMKNFGAMKRMSIGVGVFAIIIIFSTVIIGMIGAIRYADLSTADFLSKVLIEDHSALIATLILIGLIAAAISTSDSQIFALGAEFRSVQTGSDSVVMKKTKIAMILFGFFAWGFSLISSNQLVMLARVSFMGTALMAPLILVATYLPGKPDRKIIFITMIGILLFLAYLLNIIPATIFGIQFDLLLLLSLFTIIFVLTAISSHNR